MINNEKFCAGGPVHLTDRPIAKNLHFYSSAGTVTRVDIKQIK